MLLIRCMRGAYYTQEVQQAHVLLRPEFHMGIFAVQAVYAYQGEELQKDIAELQRGILDAHQILDAASKHLKSLNVVRKEDATDSLL